VNKQFAKKMIGYASASILHKNVKLKLAGDDVSVRVMEYAINASRGLHEALEASSADISVISTALTQKYAASKKFKQHFGFTWPL
jgi:hypothetical protein